MSTGQCLSHTRAVGHARGATIPVGGSRWRGHAISSGKLSKSCRILTTIAVRHRSTCHVWGRMLAILRIAVLGLTCLNRKHLLLLEALCFRLDSHHLLWRMSRHASASCHVSMDQSRSHAFVW